VTIADAERERRTEYMREYRDRHRKLPNGYGALVTLIFQEEPWQEDAACKGVVEEHGNYDAFWQPNKEAGSTATTRTKYERCASCPVAWECFEYADRIDAQGGIWGGMDGEPRRKLVNQYGSAAKARDAHARYLSGLRSKRDRRVVEIERAERKRLA
jgi:hypothetical protein